MLLLALFDLSKSTFIPGIYKQIIIELVPYFQKRTTRFDILSLWHVERNLWTLWNLLSSVVIFEGNLWMQCWLNYTRPLSTAKPFFIVATEVAKEFRHTSNNACSRFLAGNGGLFGCGGLFEELQNPGLC